MALNRAARRSRGARGVVQAPARGPAKRTCGKIHASERRKLRGALYTACALALLGAHVVPLTIPRPAYAVSTCPGSASIPFGGAEAFGPFSLPAGDIVTVTFNGTFRLRVNGADQGTFTNSATFHVPTTGTYLFIVDNVSNAGTATINCASSSSSSSSSNSTNVQQQQNQARNFAQSAMQQHQQNFGDILRRNFEDRGFVLPDPKPEMPEAVRKALEAELAMARARLMQIRAEIQGRQAEIARLRAKIAGLNAQLALLDAAFKLREGELLRFGQQLQALRAAGKPESDPEVQRVLRLREVAAAQAAELSLRAQSLGDTIGEDADDIDAAEGRVEALEGEAAQLESKISSIEKTLGQGGELGPDRWPQFASNSLLATDGRGPRGAMRWPGRFSLRQWAQAQGDRAGIAQRSADFHWNAFVDGTISGFDRDGAASTTGIGVTVLGGIDYRWNDALTVGWGLGFEHQRQDTSFNSGRLRGNGVTFGPYLGWRPFQNVVATLFLGGTVTRYSQNDPIMSASFTGVRFFINAGLTGNWRWGNWRFSPQASIFYATEHQESYTDSRATPIPSQQVSAGRFSFGPEIAYRWRSANGRWALEPYAFIAGEIDFASDRRLTVANGVVIADSRFGARIGGGVNIALAPNVSAKLGISYGGIGRDYDSVTGEIRLTLRW